MKRNLLVGCFLFLLTTIVAQPVELGKVNWLRDFEVALQQSKEEQKPVFILFQEVPGCLTCRNYGQYVLSHPLIVEAIETYFVPLAIYNNKTGSDRAVLNYYREPSWNNPVVRIVQSDKKDLLSRLSGNYSELGVTQTIIQAIDLQNKVVPEWLRLLEQELQAREIGTRKATVSMYCFWSGEKTYGELNGVVATEPGFMNGHEVVQVEYNPYQLSYTELLKAGQAADCADAAYTNEGSEQRQAQQILGQTAAEGRYRPDKDNKYYLSRTPYRFVPMTDLQAARVNARLGARQLPGDLLSPRQHARAKQYKEKGGGENVIGQNIAEVWW